MFVSDKEAKNRLADPRNRLRSPSAPASSVPTKKTPEPEVPNTVDVPTPQDPRLSDDKLLTIAALDSLIGKRTRTPYTDLETQVGIAQTVDLLGPTTTGALFDRHAGQMARYPNGFTSGRDADNRKHKAALKERIDEYREVLTAKAAGRLEAALDCLNDTKLSEVKRATNISKIAKDMASIVEKVTPKKDSEGAGVHFHIYRPEQHEEAHYEVVTVGTPPIIDLPPASVSSE